MAESPRELVNDIKSTGRHALEAGKSIYSDTKSELKSGYSTMRKKTEAAVRTSENFVKEHPFATILGACAVGFIAGLISRRNRH